MVRHCVVCKVYKNIDSEEILSFHRLPSDPLRRNIWLASLNLDLNEKRKFLEVCSKHFASSDFMTTSSGKRILKPGSNPMWQTEKSPTPSCSTLTTLSEAEPEIQELMSAKSEKENVPQELMSAEREKENLPPINLSPFPSSSSTISAVEEHNAIILQNVLLEPANTLPQAKRRKLLITPFKLPTSPVYSSPSTLSAVEEVKKKRHDIVRYAGDISVADISNPEKARQHFNILKNTIKRQKKQIKTLQTSVKRSKRKINSLKELFKVLKSKNVINESSEMIINASLSGAGLKLFERILKKTAKPKYCEDLRSFALTLAFYSPRAYNFVRSTVNKALPHLRTISKWYASVDGSAGFTKEVINTLKVLNAQAASKNKEIICNLVMDEMSIRKHIEWDGHKYFGYVNINAGNNSDTMPEAKEALVFMLVALNSSWKLPVGYFLLDGLGAEEKAELVKKCLEFLHETGITISSLTFDGAPVNISMARKLGANFNNFNNLTTHFKHPISDYNIFIFPDPSHMIKLIRNSLGAHKQFTDCNGGTINWDFIVKLVDKQLCEGLHLATKVRQRHLLYVKEKMKVKIATQTLSKSVADAILYLCEDLKVPGFSNAQATANFILKCNDLFDIFNSRNLFAKYFFKRALSPATADVFFNYLDDVYEYLRTLKLGNILIVESRVKTGFLGFLVCIKSLKSLYLKYILEEKKLSYILTNKISQDHLELFFGTIRSKGGFNNNPSARQFEAAYKRILIHNQIKAPETGNISADLNLTILTCNSGKTLTHDENGDILMRNSYLEQEQIILDEMQSNDFINSTAWNLTTYVDDVVSYVAGFVVKSIKKCVTCSNCLNMLESDDVVSKLQIRKTFGRLVNASKFVISVCKNGEKYFRYYQKTTNIFNVKKNNLLDILVTKTLATLESSHLEYFQDHLFTDDPTEGHCITLIKLILRKYFHLRIFHEINKKNEANKKARVRNTLTKAILFHNE